MEDDNVRRAVKDAIYKNIGAPTILSLVARGEWDTVQKVTVELDALCDCIDKGTRAWHFPVLDKELGSEKGDER